MDYFGPTDFLQLDAHRLPNGQVHDPADSPESQLIGGAIQEHKQKTTRANPITYVILQEYAPGVVVFQARQASIRWVGNEDGVAHYPACNAVRSDQRPCPQHGLLHAEAARRRV